MVWLKRNLSLAISGFIALGLLGYGAWYLYSAIQKNKAVDEEIQQTKRDIERLLGMPITPSATNLANAQREYSRMAAFNSLARKQFPAAPQPQSPLTSETFKTLLQTTVNEIQQRARAVGITVEPSYYFTFESHKGSLEFDPSVLRPLFDRLNEVQLICSVLLEARVNRIVSIRRAAVPGERPVGNAPAGGDYLSVSSRPQAEVGMTVWPYEVTFDCFTSQLGSVLEALERSNQGLLVKAITSELAPVTPEGAKPTTAQRNPVQAPGQRPATSPARAPGALETVINEKLLRVTLHIEIVRPETMAPPAGRQGRPTQ